MPAPEFPIDNLQRSAHLFSIVLGAVLVCAWPLGLYMARVFQGERTVLSPMMRPSSVPSMLLPAFGCRLQHLCCRLMAMVATHLSTDVTSTSA